MSFRILKTCLNEHSLQLIVAGMKHNQHTMNEQLYHTLRGVIVPLVTPLSAHDTLDQKGLHNLIEHVITGGVAGIFILGTTGEAQHLSYRTRREMISRSAQLVGRRVPLLVGISDTSVEEAVSLAAIAACKGATAVVATPPYYYHPGQPELVHFYTTLADAIELPLYLYNMPSHVKVNIEPETVLVLAEHSNIAGLKDSYANGVYFQKLLHLFKGKPFSLFMGPEEITAEVVMMGGHGGVNGGANLFPSLYVQLYQAAVKRDYATIEQLQELVMTISTSLYTVGRYASSYLMGVKTALHLKGLCSDCMSNPFNSFEGAERELLRDRLQIIESRLSQLSSHL